MSTRPCAACGRPVVLAQPHITVNRHVEQHRRGAVDVFDAETIAWLHLRCGWGVGEDQAAADVAVALDEPIPYALAEADPGAEVASETNDEPAAGEPGRACLWCGTLPAPHVVLGDPLCAGCYADHRAEVDRGAES